MPPALPVKQQAPQSYMPQQYMPQDAWTTQFGPMQNHAGGI
jgi:hypothetical protein